MLSCIEIYLKLWWIDEGREKGSHIFTAVIAHNRRLRCCALLAPPQILEPHVVLCCSGDYAFDTFEYVYILAPRKGGGGKRKGPQSVDCGAEYTRCWVVC